MSNPNLWTFYENPPQKCVDAVGKFFYHKEHETKVKVLSIHLHVEYVVKEKDVKFGNVPLGSPLIHFEFLSGDFTGQKLMMAQGCFFRFFSERQ